MKRCTAKCCARVPAKLHLLARLSLQGCLWQGEAFMLFSGATASALDQIPFLCESPIGNRDGQPLLLLTCRWTTYRTGRR